MFRISASPAYWAKVEVPVKDENGKDQIMKFDAQFKRVTQEELEELIERGRRGQLPDAQLLDQVWLNWRGVGDEAGEELSFNATNRARLCAIVPTQACVVKAFFTSIGSARLGN